MAEVSSVVLNYAVRGADRAQRKDRQVRESIQRTGREAQQQAGTIRRWMERHQAAMAGIAAATAGAMLAIVQNSPTLRGELAGVRLAFSLFAMTVGEDVAPALRGLSDVLLDLQESYSGLPEAIRKPISAFIGFATAATFVVTALAGLETVIGGTAIAGVLSTIAGYATAAGSALAGLVSVTAAAAAAIAGLLVVGGLVVSELLGITDATNMISESQNELIRSASNLLFFLLGPFIGAVATVYAFWKGGWDNAKRVALRFIDETGKAFLRFIAGIGALLSSFSSLIHTSFEVAWDFAVNATKAAWNQITGYVVSGVNSAISKLNDFAAKTESSVNSAISALNKLPDVNIGQVSLGRVGQLENNDRFDVESPQSIVDRGQSRLRDRLERTQGQLEAFREYYAAEEIALTPTSGSDPAASTPPQPAARSPQRVDNSVTVESLSVPINTTGNEELDGERVGQEAMRYIEEQQQQRQ